MDLFGIKEHEQQHQDLERHVRRLVEQVAQLTIDLGETRMQLRKLAIELEGKVSTDEIEQLKENLEFLLNDLKRAKPSTSKGVYLRKISLSTTMGAGLAVDQASLAIK